MRVKGKIIKWNDEKGFGFITPITGGKEVFVHISAFKNRSRRPDVSHVVTYTLSADKHGRPCAKDALLAGDRPAQVKKQGNGYLPVIGAIFFMAIVSISALTAKIPPIVFALYIFASLLTYFLYAADKSAAQKGAWRIKEDTLHLFSLLGGWPGALIAQQQLRHKSQKESFRVVFWITVAMNCGMFIWIQTQAGAYMLQSFIAGIT